MGRGRDSGGRGAGRPVSGNGEPSPQGRRVSQEEWDARFALLDTFIASLLDFPPGDDPDEPDPHLDLLYDLWFAECEREAADTPEEHDPPWVGALAAIAAQSWANVVTGSACKP